MAVQKITGWLDKLSKIVRSNRVYEWWAEDANEVKSVVNNNADELQSHINSDNPHGIDLSSKTDSGGYNGTTQDVVDLIPDVSVFGTVATTNSYNDLDDIPEDILTESDLEDYSQHLTEIRSFKEITKSGSYRLVYSSAESYPDTNLQSIIDNSVLNFTETFLNPNDTDLNTPFLGMTSGYSFILDVKEVAGHNLADETDRLELPNYTTVVTLTNPDAALQNSTKSDFTGGTYSNGDVLKIVITESNSLLANEGYSFANGFTIESYFQYEEIQVTFGVITETIRRFTPVGNAVITSGVLSTIEGTNLRAGLDIIHESLLEYTDYYDDEGSVESDYNYSNFPLHLTDGSSYLNWASNLSLITVPIAPPESVFVSDVKNSITGELLGAYFSSNPLSSAASSPIVYIKPEYIFESELENIYSTYEDLFFKYNPYIYEANYIEGFLEIPIISTLFNKGAKHSEIQYIDNEGQKHTSDVSYGRIYTDLENSSENKFVIKDPAGEFNQDSTFTNLSVNVVVDNDLTADNIQRGFKNGMNVINVEYDPDGAHHRRMQGWVLNAFYANTNGSTPDFRVEFGSSATVNSYDSIDYLAKKFDASVGCAPITNLTTSTKYQFPENFTMCYALGSNANQVEIHEFGYEPAEYSSKLIVIRGGVLNEVHGTTTSSWGIGTTFVEPSSDNWKVVNIPSYFNQGDADANRATINAGSEDVAYSNFVGGVGTGGDDEHDQSPSSGQVAGKIVAIMHETRITDKKVIIDAMIETADRLDDYFLLSITNFTWDSELPAQKNYSSVNNYIGAIKNEFRGAGDLLFINNIQVSTLPSYGNTGNYIFEDFSLSSFVVGEGTFLIEIFNGGNPSQLLYRDYISVWNTTTWTGDYSTIDNRWNPFDGYGIVNVSAAVSYLLNDLETYKQDNLTALKDKFEMPSYLTYEDIPESVPVPKKLLPETDVSGKTDTGGYTGTSQDIVNMINPEPINNSYLLTHQGVTLQIECSRVGAVVNIDILNINGSSSATGGDMDNYGSIDPIFSSSSGRTLLVSVPSKTYVNPKTVYILGNDIYFSAVNGESFSDLWQGSITYIV